MRYFWLLDAEAQRMFTYKYFPGLENLADYTSKHHTGATHQRIRPYYTHMPTSPTYMDRAAKPSIRRGCVKLGPDSYVGNQPLPLLKPFPIVTDTWTAAAG